MRCISFFFLHAQPWIATFHLKSCIILSILCQSKNWRSSLSVDGNVSGLAWNDVSMNNIWNDVSMNNMTSFSWNFSENVLVEQIFSFFRVHIRVYKIRFISFDISCTYPSLVCKKTNLMLHHGHQFLFFIAYTTGTKRFINFVLTKQKFRFLEDTHCSWNLRSEFFDCVRKIQNVLNWKNRQFSTQIA